MVEDSEFLIGLDVSKDSHAVAVAEGGRGGEVQDELMAAMAPPEAATSEVFTRSVERRKMAAEAVGRLREISC